MKSIISSAAILLLLQCSCRPAAENTTSTSPPSASAPEAVQLTPEQARALGIVTAPAEAPKRNAMVVLRGVVVPENGRQASVFAPFPGRLLAPENGFPVVGQSLEQGEVLGEVEQLPDATESQQLSDQRLALEAEIDRARKELDQLNRELERNRKLFEAGLIPKKQVEQAELDSRQARIRLEEAQKSKASFDRLKDMDSGPARVQLRAPIGGVVLAVHAVHGEQVDSAASLLDLVDTDMVGVVCQLTEEYLPLVRQVLRVEVVIPADPQKVYRGQFVAIAPQADSTTRMQQAIYSVQNRKGELSLDAAVEVHLPELPDQGAVPVCRIPAEAIIREGQANVVFVETQSQLYQKRVVESGPGQNGMVPVFKGLAPGDSVVVEGLSGLLSRMK